MDFSASALFDVKGKVCVVTGGGTGLGLEIATVLENNGAIVYILGRRKNILDNAAEKYAKNGKIYSIVCDVTKKDDLLKAVAEIKEQSGHVDILFANSGVMSENQIKATESIKKDAKALSEYFMQCSQENWQDTFEVNVTSVFFTVMAFLELLDLANKKNGIDPFGENKPTHKSSSQVVITASIAGVLRVVPMSFTYNVTKAATIHLGKMLSTYLLPFDIRVNTICPGMFPSEMTGGAADQTSNKNTLGDFPRSIIPLGRAGAENEIAGLALYLAAPTGAYCNGTVFVIDGGRVAMLPASY
ncbi:hypothetical protein V1511DRAFT_505043 [Dipodascopsis uninucleata]